MGVESGIALEYAHHSRGNAVEDDSGAYLQKKDTPSAEGGHATVVDDEMVDAPVKVLTG